jgi:hypothetical protein
MDELTQGVGRHVAPIWCDPFISSRLRPARGGGSAWTPSVRHQVQGARPRKPSRRVDSCMARALMSWSCWRQRETDSRRGRRRRGGAPAVARTGTATDDRGRAHPVPSLGIPCLQPTLHAAAASRARALSGAAHHPPLWLSTSASMQAVSDAMKGSGTSRLGSLLDHVR